MKLHIKKGDTVKVLSGKSKNAIGVVLRVYPKTSKVIVEGVNIVKKHLKKEDGKKGSVISREAPIPICNVMYYDVKLGVASRIGRRLDENGVLRRYLKRTNSFV